VEIVFSGKDGSQSSLWLIETITKNDEEFFRILEHSRISASDVM